MKLAASVQSMERSSASDELQGAIQQQDRRGRWRQFPLRRREEGLSQLPCRADACAEPQ